MLKVIDNLLSNPDEEKYRQLKLKNMKIKAAIVDSVGGIELMKAIGQITDIPSTQFKTLSICRVSKTC